MHERLGLSPRAAWPRRVLGAACDGQTRGRNAGRRELSPAALREALSAVIACYRDAPAVPIMHERLVRRSPSSASTTRSSSSTTARPDNAREVLAELAARDPHVVVINHSRTFGSQSAFTSGMQIATGDAVVLLDGDLQDPPELIPEFVAQLAGGLRRRLRRARQARGDAVHADRLQGLLPRLHARCPTSTFRSTPATSA